ncbi:3'-5' exonuclease [Paenibacillus arenilitoris]|uniref:Exonuclease domain-containing protein n=1 Tax=Paenibacillus arenilitoris TaxID=2772299 RepID=A0A927CQZ2_9BACL|nr:3'-5' exonuclease [Paenibacillus arenilitoris]MBD2872549.1 exonuclease domain-containing protein [Paenibacillus arenilitoris]
MQYIVYDLEFTVLRNRQYMADILEIGAIKLSDDSGQLNMIDLFHTHVRPTAFRAITPLTTAFTGITQEQVDAAPSFSEAVEAFRQWIDDEPHYMCSWGPDDKQQLIRHCTMHEIGLEWIQNHNDIQLSFTRLQGSEYHQRWGLKRALAAKEIHFIGSHHNALDDAFNTAKLFKHIFPHITLEQNNAAAEQRFTTSLVYTTGHEKNNPFGQLAELFRVAT